MSRQAELRFEFLRSRRFVEVSTDHTAYGRNLMKGVLRSFLGLAAIAEHCLASRPPDLLTFRAVVALPARQADDVARRRARVVAELVVSRPAQVAAALSVVVGVARHPKLKLDARIGRHSAVLRPLRANVQHSLHRQPVDQSICVAGRKRKKRCYQ